MTSSNAARERRSDVTLTRSRNRLCGMLSKANERAAMSAM